MSCNSFCSELWTRPSRSVTGRRMNFLNRRSNTPHAMRRSCPRFARKLDERIASDDLTRALKLENECVMPIAEMELNGFYLDKARWREQLDKVSLVQQKTAGELQNMLAAGVAQASLFGAPQINLDSHQQVTDALSQSWRARAEHYASRGNCNHWQKNIRRWQSCSSIAPRQKRARVLARTFLNLSSLRRVGFMPTFARSACRPDALRVRSQTCSRYRTRTNIAAAFELPRDESSLSPTIRRSSCGSWRTFRMTKILSRRSSRVRIFTRPRRRRFLM